MSKTTCLPLADLAYIRVQGTDAEGFLQGQLSNDIRLLTLAQAQLAAYNSPKGRMLAVMHLFRDTDGIVLELHRSLLESVLKRLRMFVLRSKVTLADVTATLPALGLIGDDAEQRLSTLDLPAPAAALQSDSRHGITVIRRIGAQPRYSLHGAAQALERLQAFAAAPERAWQRQDLLAGVPTVYPETSDHFVAQMANLDQLGGISFTKGCYTGQEIVARLHYLGQLKRRMFVGRSPATASSMPGQPVYDRDGDAQAVGEVVDALADGDGLLLNVVMQLSHAASGNLSIGALDGSPLHLETTA